MKVLLLNSYDIMGGAARAATRLLTGVRARGIDARMLVQFKFGSDEAVLCSGGRLRQQARRLKLLLGLLPTRLYRKRPENNFSPAFLPDNLLAEVATLAPDIVHLHWLGVSFLQVETLRKFKRPLVWTLHDSWAFTGGCHVPFACTGYRQKCGACPVLGSARERDLSRWIWRRKKKAWAELNLTVVTPSRWLADCARSSSLFANVRIEVIPNGLDTDIFRPLDKAEARQRLGLPEERNIILFGAIGATADPNKGFSLLQEALQRLGAGRSDLLAVVFGSDATDEMAELGIEVSCLGRINDDEKLAAVYAAADVFVAPSLLENLPNTIMEAMACGTPCVAFRQGGVPELIEHGETGYLAPAYDSAELARGIAWVLEDRDRRTQLAGKARQKVEAEFQLAQIAQRYDRLYAELLCIKERVHG